MKKSIPFSEMPYTEVSATDNWEFVGGVENGVEVKYYPHQIISIEGSILAHKETVWQTCEKAIAELKGLMGDWRGSEMARYADALENIEDQNGCSVYEQLGDLVEIIHKTELANMKFYKTDGERMKTWLEERGMPRTRNFGSGNKFVDCK